MDTLTTKQELSLLRSAVIALVGRDREGAYRSSFVRSTLAALKDKPTKRFSSPQQFLKGISEV